MKQTEKSIQNAILREFGTRTDMRVWRQNTGVARMGARVVRFGIPGQADLTGVLPGGMRLEIECKTADGRLSIEQQNFRAMVTRFGGVYVVARSVSDVRRVINRFLVPPPAPSPADSGKEAHADTRG